MGDTEKRVPLTAEDIAKLKRSNRSCLIVFLVFIVLVIAGAFITYNSVSYGPSFPLLLAGIALLIIGAAFFGMKSNSRRTAKDLRAGQKTVLTTEVKKQEPRVVTSQTQTPMVKLPSRVQTQYSLEIAGRAYAVSEADYNKFTDGQVVEVHAGPNSGTLLGIYDPNDGSLLLIK